MAMRENTMMVSKRRVPQIEQIKDIDPRDYEFFEKIHDEQGKILPPRYTGPARANSGHRAGDSSARVMGCCASRGRRSARVSPGR